MTHIYLGPHALKMDHFGSKKEQQLPRGGRPPVGTIWPKHWSVGSYRLSKHQLHVASIRLGTEDVGLLKT